MEQRSLKQERILELDGLRGVAILLVISFHYINNQLLYSTHPIGKWLCKATSFGWVGVDLFFVLSGFLIGSILIRTRNSKNFFYTFYIRRIIRIIPNYFLFLIVMIVIQATPYFSDNYMLAGNNVIPIGSYFLMIHNFYMASMNNIGNASLCISWSIGIEEQFYLTIPLVVYFLKERWLPLFLIGAIIIAIIVRMQYIHWVPRYVLLPARMDSIAMGILVAYLNKENRLIFLVQKYWYLFFGLIVIDVMTCGVMYYLYNDLGALKHTLFAFFFANCLAMALAKIPGYSAILRNSVICWIGTIS
jgi:peptidoglycan/LPS O-acetylase OafA/YrhL